MLASPLQSQRIIRSKVSVISPLRRSFNTGNLAIVLFVALALLSSSRGKEVETTKAEVVIEDYSFSPSTLTLPAGTTVTWTNRDSMPHTVISAGNRFPKSAMLKPGQSYSSNFAAPGTYSYFCSIHPRMTGKIIVK